MDFILNNKTIISRKTNILNKINVPTCNSEYQLTDEDLVYLADKCNKYLVVITTNSNKMDKTFSNIEIIYWKSDRPYISMFHRDNHWTPGIINKEYKPMTLHSTVTYTSIPYIATIQKNIDKHFERYVNRSNTQLHNNTSEKKMYLETKDEQTVMWCNNTQKTNDFDD